MALGIMGPGVMCHESPPTPDAASAAVRGTPLGRCGPARAAAGRAQDGRAVAGFNGPFTVPRLSSSHLGPFLYDRIHGPRITCRAPDLIIRRKNP
eukprot:765737-Hanusia_phi.AAC.4